MQSFDQLGKVSRVLRRSWWKGSGETSRMKRLKEVKGGDGFGEGKRVAAREASVAWH